MPQKSASTRPGGLNKRNSINRPNKNFGVVTKRKTKLARHSVLKMLAVMEASQDAGPSGAGNAGDPKAPGPPVTPSESATNREDFLQSGRTGRRNALPDILGQNASVTSSDLPSRLEGLTTTDRAPQKGAEETPGTSKS